MSAPAIVVDDLTYAYPDGTVALNGLSLAVEEGDRAALLGPNGAGKSTLILHLNGILHADRRVRVLGRGLHRSNLREVRRDVGLVFQNPDDQLFCPSIEEDVAFGPRNLGLDDEEVRRRVADSLHAVGLDGLGKKAAFHLSIGQRKRAALATVLAMDARILVLDEPTAGLDPRGRREIAALLRRLGRTQVIATHDLALVRELCTHAFVLLDGRVAAQGSPDELLRDEAGLERYGLA